MKMEDHTPAVGCIGKQGVGVRSCTRITRLVADQSIPSHHVYLSGCWLSMDVDPEQWEAAMQRQLPEE